MAAAYVVVRLTPGDRERARAALLRVMGAVLDGVRVYTTEETSLKDTVMRGPRGWSLPMPTETADRIATLLDTAGEAELAARFRSDQRARPTRDYLAAAYRAARVIPPAALTAELTCALCSITLRATRFDCQTWLDVADLVLRLHLRDDCPDTHEKRELTR